MEPALGMLGHFLLKLPTEAFFSLTLLASSLPFLLPLDHQMFPQQVGPTQALQSSSAPDIIYQDICLSDTAGFLGEGSGQL